jgi:DeoR family transcriptional regulator, suf operon transcriptional repressor
METLSSLGNRQQSLLRRLLHNESGLTLDRLAGQLGISRNAVAQHINVLEGLNYVQGAFLPSGGGRPGRAYHLTPEGKALFTKQYSLFSTMLLRSLSAALKPAELEILISHIGNELAEPFRNRVDQSKDKIEEVRRILEELGYETLQAQASSYEIVAKNCVFHDLAIENDQVCELDRSLITTLLRQDIEQTECMAKGDASCRFCVAVK